jgi:hypothetical protein
MQSPEQRYLSQPVRHATPLLPLRLRDIGRFFLALGGRAPRRGHC